MATATNSSAGRAKKNLFKEAAHKALNEKDTRKKETGTLIVLPENTTGTRQFHDAVSEIIVASAEKTAAENKLNNAKGILGKFIHADIIERMVEAGGPLPTPIRVANDKNESATYLLVDKSKQYPLNDDQIEELTELFGDKLESITKVEEVYSLSPKVMAETVSSGETVQQVIGDLLSQAIQNTKRLTAEQKKNLITCKRSVRLKPDCHKNAVTICGSVRKITAFFAICKTQIARYLQA